MNYQKGSYGSKWSLKKVTRCFVAFGTIVPLLFIVSCIPQNDPSPIFNGVNTESIAGDIGIMVDGSAIKRFSDGWHGAINPGGTFMFYSDLPDLMTGGHLQVYCPQAGAEGLPTIGYYNADVFPTETAYLIRDYYLNVQPTTSDVQIRNMSVSWSNLNTEFPVYQIAIPDYLPGRNGTLYHIQILGGAATGGPPPIQVVDSSNSVKYQMDPEGRSIIVRRGDSTSEVSIISTNMSSSSNTPVLGVSTQFLPQITTDMPLAYLLAGIFPSATTPGCYDGSGGIKVNTQSTEDPLTLQWSYNFYPTIYSSGTLASNTCYVLMVGVTNQFSKYGGPIEKLTQGMGGATVTDSTQAIQDDVGDILCQANPTGVIVYPYYFCTGN